MSARCEMSSICAELAKSHRALRQCQENQVTPFVSDAVEHFACGVFSLSRRRPRSFLHDRSGENAPVALYHSTPGVGAAKQVSTASCLPERMWICTCSARSASKTPIRTVKPISCSPKITATCWIPSMSFSPKLRVTYAEIENGRNPPFRNIMMWISTTLRSVGIDPAPECVDEVVFVYNVVGCRTCPCRVLETCVLGQASPTAAAFRS